MTVADGVLGEVDRNVLDAVVALLLGNQVALRDRDLLELGVAGQLDDLHAVLQRDRDPLQVVRRRDEHDVAEVVVEIQVVVVERRVLLRIQHLQQRRRRIAAEVGRHLVDLVEEEDRVLRPGLLQRLDDLARQRADVRAPVATNLRLVAHAAQRQPHEVAPGRLRDRARQRRLAHARRSDEAHDRPLQLLHQRLHGQVLEDPLLDLLQAVVVLVEDPLGVDDVQLLLGLLAPGQRQHPVEVVAHDRRLRRHRRHHAQLLELLLDLGQRLFRQALLLGPVFQLRQLVLEFVAIAQLLLDRLHLLVEVVLLLRLLHLLLDARPDLPLDLQDLDLRLDQLVEPRQALGRRVHLQHRLLVTELQLQLARPSCRRAVRDPRSSAPRSGSRARCACST